MKRLFPLFATLCLILSSCGGKDPQPVPPPAPDPDPDPALELSVSDLGFGREGGSEQIDVKSNMEWTASCDAAWCRLVNSSGKGNGKISLSVDVNEGYDSRNTVITVSCKGLSKTVSVSQAMTQGLFITKPDYDLSNSSQTVNVEVSTNVELDVKVDAACSSWVTYVATKGLSTRVVSFDIQSNSGYDMREGSAVVSSKDGSLSGRVTFRQAENLGLKLETGSYSCKADGSEIDVKVLSNVEYDVVIPASASSWISLASSDTKALSESSFKLKVAKNESCYDREASVTVKQKDGSLSASLKVYQEEAPDPVIVRTDAFDETHIVKSFAVVSDIHIDKGTNAPSEKFVSAMNQLQTLSGGLDAVLVSGDMVQAPGYNGGSDYSEIGIFKNLYESIFDPEKVPLVYTLGNHDVPWNSMMTGAYNVSNYFGSKYYLKDRDNSARASMECRHVQIDRCHILCVSPISTGAAYNPQAVKWLDEQLASITVRHPEDYVIVLTHPMIYDTVYGSTLYTGSLAWYTKELTGVLSKYHQVIVFGGHLHFPINDPTSIWQGDFTACGTGSVRYMAIENAGYLDMASATTMKDKDEYSEGYLLQIDESGNIRLTRMDFYRKAQIGKPWEISYPRADKKHLEKYSFVKRSLANAAPQMSYIKVNEIKQGIATSYEMEFAAAVDDEFAHHYVVTISEGYETVATWRILSDFYRSPQPEDMKKVWKRELGSLSPGNYTITAKAYDSWTIPSNEVSCNFTVKEISPKDTELYVDVDFASGSVTDSKGNAAMTNHSAEIAAVTLSHKGSEYTVPAAHLTGMNGYIEGKFKDITTSSSFQGFCNLGFAVEALYVDKQVGSGVHGIFCATERGGWGLANRATSAPYFIVGDVSSNNYKSVDASAVSTSELTHVVGVYDVTAKKISIYVNGALVTSTAFTGPFYPGEGDTFNRFILGGDTKPSVIAGDFPPVDMYLVDAKFYSGALDASAVAKAYSDSIDSLK